MFTEAESYHPQLCSGVAGHEKEANMLPDAYGCAVANRYGDLLDDDADPFDLISKVEKEKQKKKKKEDEEKKGKQKKAGQKESQKNRRLPFASEGQDPAPVQKQQQQARPGPVTERGDGREEARRGQTRAAFGERWANKEEYPQELSTSKPSYNADSDLRGRGGNRGRRGVRGGVGYSRNSDNYDLRGKRGFDRHNGTGISPEEKRGGRGPWNWGSVEEAARGESMEVISYAPVKSEEPQTTAEEENQNRVMEEEDGEVLVQVAMEMSLDEWKALQETSRPKAEFNIRKSENKMPSKAMVIHKSKHVENVKEATLEDVEDEGNFLRRSVNDITSLLDINFGSLGRPSRGGRGRGARGGPANRPERAKPIMEREDDLCPNPDDPEDFPALSAGK
ncbi:intracellular hyaluronan-binding protein 4-like [Anoplopoma fimbria]|uniref:intracellular hyaluronan-binding protein 4-like n=1 Tax=Anoplopoma fimbria TaxID=229290 RepID=UPI0023ECB699|nr:intracellular hyaluronan-binding protein 4-like [Anoplopoma fimbria]XP_054467471.1 intracellular hyaluronan-binding protein 4-like [Anoplopoma fimbria]